MEIVFSKKEAINAIALASSIIKNSMPILLCMHIKTYEDYFTITTTNLEVTYIKKIPCVVKSPGEICIPAKKFVEIVKSLQFDSIILKSIKDTTTILSENSKFSLLNADVSMFPSVVDNDKEMLFTIPFGIFANAVYKSSFCISDDMSRIIFTGVYIKGDGESITFVSTDGKRLSEYKIPIKHIPFDFVTPVPALDLIVKEVFDGDVLISTVKGHLSFVAGDTTVICNKLQGEYPDYKRAFPNEYSNSVKVNKTELLTALKLSAILSTKELSKAIIEIATDNIQIKCSDEKTGEAVNTINCIAQEPTLIAVNHNYFMSILARVENEEITLLLGGKKPIIIKDNNNIFLLMPLRV